MPRKGEKHGEQDVYKLKVFIDHMMLKRYKNF